MELRESRSRKNKQLFHKTLQNLKSFRENYLKLPLPKSVSFHPFSCGNRAMKHKPTSRYYLDFCNAWECDLEKAIQRRTNDVIVANGPKEGEDELRASSMKSNQDPREKIEEQRINTVDGENYALAEKIKHLEMLEIGDMEHVLDVEEALHYYSRLKCPIYLDIIDKFFKDMCTEFRAPQDSVNNIINHSKLKRKSQNVDTLIHI